MAVVRERAVSDNHIRPSAHSGLKIRGCREPRPARAPLNSPAQCLSQDLETGCLKLAVVKSLGVQIFNGDHNILIFQP